MIGLAPVVDAGGNLEVKKLVLEEMAEDEERGVLVIQEVMEANRGMVIFVVLAITNTGERAHGYEAHRNPLGKTREVLTLNLGQNLVKREGREPEAWLVLRGAQGIPSEVASPGG